MFKVAKKRYGLTVGGNAVFTFLKPKLKCKLKQTLSHIEVKVPAFVFGFLYISCLGRTCELFL